MSSVTSIKQRQSGIELLKIIAMFLIMFFHCIFLWEYVPLQDIDFNKATREASNFIAQIFMYLGVIGNLVFLVSSSWFLVDSKRLKINKIANMISDTYVFSIAFLLAFIVAGVDLSAKEILKSLFPNTFANNWYITCYILLYMIYPLLNNVIENLTQKQHLAYNFIFFILYYCINSIKGGLFFTSSLIGFIGMYFFVAYIKKYMIKLVSSKKVNIICLLIGILLLILLQLTMNTVGLHVDAIGSRVLHFKTSTDNHNPIMLLIVFPLFNLFRGIKLQSKFINYISSLTMLLFVIHYNFLYNNHLASELMFNLWKMTGEINFLLFLFAYAVLLFIASTVIAIIYNKLLQLLVHKISEIIMNFIIRIYGKVESFILKID